MNGLGWEARFGWWLNMENQVPLYSFVANVSAFIIRLFLEFWAIIIQALLKLFVFVTREMVSRGVARLGIPSTVNHWAQSQQGSQLESIPMGLLVKWVQVAASSLAYGCSFISPLPHVYTSYPHSVLRFLNTLGLLFQNRISKYPILILLFPEKPTLELL